MAIGLRLIAELAPPSQKPEQFMSDIADWVGRKCSDLLPEIRQVMVHDSPAIFCRLHPAAEEVELSLADSKHFMVSASTSSAGPGYHIFLVSLLKDWAHDFQASWQQPKDESGEYGDETEYFFTGDEQSVFSNMTDWLQRVATLFFDGTFDPDDKGILLSMPLDAGFASEQLAITPLGPRNRDWMYQTSQDGRRGKDFFAWWAPGLNAEYYLGRALTLMWAAVRWRPPVNDSERNLLRTVAGSLSQAFKINPDLPYPWVEWGEILQLLGTDSADKDLVLAHAKGNPEIGYRRGKVWVALTGGWRIRIPGSFSEFDWNQDDNLYALDPPREIWFTSFRWTTPLADQQFEATKRELRESKPDHRTESDEYAAKATITKKVRETGEEYFVMNTLNVCPAKKAVCTLIYSLAEEEAWAVEVWKSLRPPSNGA